MGSPVVLNPTQASSFCLPVPVMQLLMRSIYHHARTKGVMNEPKIKHGDGVAVGMRGGKVYLLLNHTLETMFTWHSEWKTAGLGQEGRGLWGWRGARAGWGQGQG